MHVDMQLLNTVWNNGYWTGEVDATFATEYLIHEYLLAQARYLENKIKAPKFIYETKMSEMCKSRVL